MLMKAIIKFERSHKKMLKKTSTLQFESSSAKTNLCWLALIKKLNERLVDLTPRSLLSRRETDHPRGSIWKILTPDRAYSREPVSDRNVRNCS